jgi:DNA primase
MLIYQLVFGTDSGQVNCVFHDDSVASSGIGPNGEFHCFACSAKAHNSAGFITKYFAISYDHAQRIDKALERVQQYAFTAKQLTAEQRTFLQQQGLTDPIIDKYFFRSGTDKLMYRHTWNGINVGYTWFNSPLLSNHNASAPKYKYDKNMIGGILSPYDDVIKYNRIVICEGEKDMLTAKSIGIPNAVAKIGGAKTRILAGINFQDKEVILVYDCDDYGREGAQTDAAYLTDRFNAKVKVVDLGLQNKEDLNDYFIKYGHTKDEFYDLIKATPVFVVTPQMKQTKIEKFLEGISPEEYNELVEKIKNKGE